MQPTKRQVYVDGILTKVSIAYMNRNYIHRELSPRIPVTEESGKYFRFLKGDFFRNEAAIRAAGDDAKISGFTISTDGYSCNEYALATKLPERILNTADNQLSLRAAKAEFVTDRIALRQEVDLANLVFSASWGLNTAPTIKWDSPTGTPIEDIIAGSDFIAENTSYEANTLVLGRAAWSGLRRNPDILDLLAGAERKIATPQLLAQALDLERVLVGRGAHNTAQEGQAPVFSYIWGKDALLCYVAPSPGQLTPSALYTFVARQERVRRWRDEGKETEIIEASVISDSKIVCPDVGRYWPGVVT